MESDLERLKNSVSNVSAFIDKAKQYTKINKLTAEILHLFIERVEVGERGEKWSRTAMQEINIYYRILASWTMSLSRQKSKIHRKHR
jgi:hypothetical protein